VPQIRLTLNALPVALPDDARIVVGHQPFTTADVLGMGSQRGPSGAVPAEL